MKVSVITTVYNVKPYIRRLLTSLENQSYRNWEFIATDDHSIDGTFEVLKQFEDKYPGKVEVFRTPKPRSGVSLGRNLAIEVSSGKYISIIDGDDWWDINFLRDTVENIKNFDAVCTEHYDVLEKEGYKKVYVKANKRGEISWRDILKLKARFANGNTLLRRSLIENYGIRFPVDFQYSEDAHFYIQYVSIADKFYVINKPEFYHLIRSGSLVRSQGNEERKILQTIRAYRDLCNVVQNITNKNVDELCKLVNSHLKPYSIMTYIASLSDSLGRDTARKYFFKYFGEISSYRPAFTYHSLLVLVWIIDIFIPIRPFLRKIVSKK